MGDFDVLVTTISVLILSTVIYNIITIISFKDILRRFGFMRISRRDFYECGFKPQVETPVKISLQFLLICVFFLLYDIELVFLFPVISGFTYVGYYDSILLIFFFAVLLLSLCIDYERHALVWQE